MQVPIYQNQIGYQGPGRVRAIAVPQPVREAEADSKLKGLEMLGDFMQGAGKITKKVQSYAAQQKEEAFAEAANTEPVYSGFSDPLRGRLLEYSRTDAFRYPSDDQNPAASLDAVQHLDDFFVQQSGATEQTASTYTDHNLLVQDYVVLRREVARIQQQQQQAVQKEQFNQAASHFVQTAALVQNPQALETYIHSNLSAAGLEARQQGVSEKQWKGQADFLTAQAVRHNIEAALYEGEVEQAKHVYTHFERQISPLDKELLSQKMTMCQAEKQAEQLVAQASRYCADENGELQEQRLSSWIKQNVTDISVPEQQALEKALQGRFSAENQSRLRREEQFYDTLLSAASQQNISMRDLMSEQCSSGQLFKQTSQWMSRIQNHPLQASDVNVFNRLQQQMMQGELTRAQLDNALEKESLSGIDCLRLKRDFCRFQTQGVNSREKLLLQSVESFCRKNDLPEQQVQTAKYFVLSSGKDLEQRLKAAYELKKILTLQEHIK